MYLCLEDVKEYFPNVTIDVGHNPLAAQVIVNEFKIKNYTYL